jgi:hypothetical protein
MAEEEKKEYDEWKIEIESGEMEDLPEWAKQGIKNFKEGCEKKMKKLELVSQFSNATLKEMFEKDPNDQEVCTEMQKRIGLANFDSIEQRQVNQAIQAKQTQLLEESLKTLKSIETILAYSPGGPGADKVAEEWHKKMEEEEMKEAKELWEKARKEHDKKKEKMYEKSDKGDPWTDNPLDGGVVNF